MEWNLVKSKFTGRVHWQRQLTENKLNIENSLHLAIKKKFFDNKNLSWDTNINNEKKLEHSLKFSQQLDWGVNELIGEFYSNETLDVKGKLIINFK